MPTPTYDLIASNVLSSSASSVTFSSIPATYRDLVLVVTSTQTTSTAFALINFNSDTGNNYAFVGANGNGSGYASFSGTFTGGLVGYQDGTNIVQIMDYSATDKHKTYLARTNGESETGITVTEMRATRWANTSAITSITISGYVQDFQSGSAFYLYGIVS